MSTSSKAVVLNASFKASPTRWLKQWITCSQVSFSSTNLPTSLCFPKLTLAPLTLISINLFVEDLFPILSKASSILCTILGASAILTGSILKYLRVGVLYFKSKTKITSSSVTLESPGFPTGVGNMRECANTWGKHEGSLKCRQKDLWRSSFDINVPALSLQACKFTKNELLHIYFWRILARF